MGDIILSELKRVGCAIFEQGQPLDDALCMFVIGLWHPPPTVEHPRIEISVDQELFQICRGWSNKVLKQASKEGKQRHLFFFEFLHHDKFTTTFHLNEALSFAKAFCPESRVPSYPDHRFRDQIIPKYPVLCMPAPICYRTCDHGYILKETPVSLFQTILVAMDWRSQKPVSKIFNDSKPPLAMDLAEQVQQHQDDIVQEQTAESADSPAKKIDVSPARRQISEETVDYYDGNYGAESKTDDDSDWTQVTKISCDALDQLACSVSSLQDDQQEDDRPTKPAKNSFRGDV